MDKDCVELRAPDGRLVRVLKKDAKEYVEQKGCSFVKDEQISDESELKKDVSLSGKVEVNGGAGVGEPELDPDPSEL